MFKIEDVKKTNELAKGKSSRKVSSETSFADFLRMNNLQETQQVQATSAVTSADAIFATQTISTEEENQIRKKLIKKGKDLLESLEEIREGLLFGEISRDRLIEISRMVKQKDISSQDEKLQEILQEIELRVEVELAKLIK